METDMPTTPTTAQRLAALPKTSVPRRHVPSANVEEIEIAEKSQEIPHVEVLSERTELSRAVARLGQEVNVLERMEQGNYPGRSEEWYRGVGEYTKPAPLNFEEAFEAKMAQLTQEARLVERSKAELESLMLIAVQVNPEKDAVYAQELRMRDEEIKLLQRELKALRRATAVVSEGVPASFWRRTGRAIEADIEDLIDAMKDPDRLQAAAQHMVETLGDFAGHCIIMADMLS